MKFLTDTSFRPWHVGEAIQLTFDPCLEEI